VVLGAGTAIALPGTNSVRSNDLKDGAVCRPPGSRTRRRRAARRRRSPTPAPGSRCVSTVQTVQTLTRLHEGEFVESVVRKTGGGNLTVSGPQAYLSLAWLGP
jgi:hypothetical protein